MDGVNLSKLKSGTTVHAVTVNSCYALEVLGGGRVRLSGGRYKTPVEVGFNGSTWGGTALKPDRVELGMHMEFDLGSSVLVTSPVGHILLVGDGWHYEITRNDPP